MSIIRIVLTGGPGSGKSSAIEALKNELRASRGVYLLDGRRCLFQSETASELILGGVAPFTCATVLEFQSILFDLQLEKERAFERGAFSIPDEDFIIFYDRGLIDGGAYLSDAEFDELLLKKGMTVDEIYKRYDAVMALETPEDYCFAGNNPARTEDAGEAKETSRRTIRLWEKHPGFVLVPPTEKFEQKVGIIKREIKRIMKGF